LARSSSLAWALERLGQRSLFERHTVTIRKGKIAKPNEFGNLVTIQEAEHQIVTAFEIPAGRPADVTLWTPALDRHQALFARAPDLAAADRGFSSARNNRRRLTAGCDASSCRAAAPSRRRGGPTNINAGSVADNAGASGARAASVCSNVVMVCADVATMASTVCTAGLDSASSPTI
jgi:hypothetical protein